MTNAANGTKTDAITRISISSLRQRRNSNLQLFTKRCDDYRGQSLSRNAHILRSAKPQSRSETTKLHSRASSSMRSVNTARYIEMAKRQRRSAFLMRAERFNGRIAMLAVLVAAAAELTLGHPLLPIHNLP